MSIYWWNYGAGSTAGAALPPSTPTLTVNEDGTLATVSGSDATATNTLKVLMALPGTGTFTWTTVGSRTGNGTIALSLASGFYWGQIISQDSGGTSVSNLVYFRVGIQERALQHSPADVLRWLLVQLGDASDPATALTVAWPGYTGSEPNAPDNCITTYDTQGTDGGRIMITGQLRGMFGVQVRIRSKDHPTGWVKAQAIQTALAEEVHNAGITIDGTPYLICSVDNIGDVLSIGKGPSDSRYKFTINVVISLIATD